MYKYVNSFNDKEFCLSNTYQLLTMGKKKLTIGYLGGSITQGVSARADGSLSDSWVNLTTNWFKKEFTASNIEFINAGVSDTATNFGLFRLEKCLMNKSGHDIPDIVFVEFCNNDWDYPGQRIEHLEGQIESLFHKIYSYNSYAEIVVVCTARHENESRSAYFKVAKKFGIPILDVGFALQDAALENKHIESKGDFYYTVDGLHPSAKGYHKYFDVIRTFLVHNLCNHISSDMHMYDYGVNAPKTQIKYHIDSPTIQEVELMEYTGNATIVKKPLCVSMFGTNDDKTEPISLTNSTMLVDGEVIVETYFEGGVLGFLFEMGQEDIMLTYSVDNSEEKTFFINDTFFAFQRYEHPQIFMLGHDFGDGTHSLKISFSKNSKLCFAGIAYNKGKF